MIKFTLKIPYAIAAWVRGLISDMCLRFLNFYLEIIRNRVEKSETP